MNTISVIIVVDLKNGEFMVDAWIHGEDNTVTMFKGTLQLCNEYMHNLDLLLDSVSY